MVGAVTSRESRYGEGWPAGGGVNRTGLPQRRLLGGGGGACGGACFREQQRRRGSGCPALFLAGAMVTQHAPRL